MSDEVVYHSAPKIEEYAATATTAEVEPEAVETSDRGLFDHFGKKEEEKKYEEAAISSEFEEKVHVSEPEPEEKKGSLPKSLLDKLHRSDSSSSSSSDEECDENGEKKKKKKKPMKEKIVKHEEDTSVPIEKYEVAPEEKKGFIEKIKEKLPGHKTAAEGYVAPPPAVVTHAEEGEHKGFIEKIKEKLPGGHKKVEEEYAAPPPPPPAVVVNADEGEHKEKKGIFEKIKEKIPGYHSKSEEEKEKEKVKESD